MNGLLFPWLAQDPCQRKTPVHADGQIGRPPRLCGCGHIPGLQGLRFCDRTNCICGRGIDSHMTQRWGTGVFLSEAVLLRDNSHLHKDITQLRPLFLAQRLYRFPALTCR